MDTQEMYLDGRNIRHLENVVAGLRKDFNIARGKKTRAEARCCPDVRGLAFSLHVNSERLGQARKERARLLQSREHEVATS